MITICTVSGHHMYRQWSLYVPSVVTIYLAHWSLYVPPVVTICTAHWSLYVPHSGHYVYHPLVTICTTSLTFTNSTFCPHSAFMCFVWIWEQTAIISLYSINWLVCITETECVYCAVRAGSLYISPFNLCQFKTLTVSHICSAAVLLQCTCATLRLLWCN